MVTWMNKNKKWIQTAVVVLSLAMLALGLYKSISWRGYAALWRNERAFKGMANGLSKPAELGVFALVALYAVRMFIKQQQKATDFTRTLLRFLQIIHIPLACVVLGSALVHGGAYVLYLWHSDFHYWSGVVALITMAGVGLLGLLTVRSRQSKYAHMVSGLTVFGIVLIHIWTA
jgi:hypothetical protein